MRPGHARRMDSVLGALHAGERVLQVGHGGAQIERAPAPRARGRVVGAALGAAYRAAAEPGLAGADGDDERAVFESCGFHDGEGDSEQLL